MAAIPIVVADAVVVDINAHSFSMPFTAVRSYADIDWPLQDADDLRVDVIPDLKNVKRVDRGGTWEYASIVDLVVRKRFEPNNSGEFPLANPDAIMDLFLSIHEFLADTRPTTFEDAVQDSIEVKVLFVAKHMREWSQYTGISRVTYLTAKEFV